MKDCKEWKKSAPQKLNFVIGRYFICRWVIRQSIALLSKTLL